MQLTVLIPTHNPNPGRFTRTLRGLMLQTLDPELWEIVIIDNGSYPPVALPPPSDSRRSRVRVVREPRLGLTFARRTGVRESSGEYLVFVDDDNVLAPDYLEKVLEGFARLPRVGALGGKSVGEFESPPADWHKEFMALLAVRDLGPDELYCLPDPGARIQSYPACAPIGAGMALRRQALQPWTDRSKSPFPDRTGTALSSAGDNEMVMQILRSGWAVAYLPTLVLTHLIPARRLETEYLGRLNRGIQSSWTRFLIENSVSPWPAIPRWTVPLRKAKAWYSHRAWQGPAQQIRWQGACGHFEGRSA